MWWEMWSKHGFDGCLSPAAVRDLRDVNKTAARCLLPHKTCLLVMGYVVFRPRDVLVLLNNSNNL